MSDTCRRVPDRAGPSRYHAGVWPPIDPASGGEVAGSARPNPPGLPFALLLRGVARQERVYGQFIAAEEWPNRAQAHLGRLFRGAERRGERRGLVAVISHRLWRERYGSDPAIVGRTLLINGKSVTVVGVLSRADTGPRLQADLWLPLRAARFLVDVPRSGDGRPGAAMAL